MSDAYINPKTGEVTDTETFQVMTYKQFMRLQRRRERDSARALGQLRDIHSDLQNLPGKKDEEDPTHPDWAFIDDWSGVLKPIRRPKREYTFEIDSSDSENIS